MPSKAQLHTGTHLHKVGHADAHQPDLDGHFCRQQLDRSLQDVLSGPDCLWSSQASAMAGKPFSFRVRVRAFRDSSAISSASLWASSEHCKQAITEVQTLDAEHSLPASGMLPLGLKYQGQDTACRVHGHNHLRALHGQQTAAGRGNCRCCCCCRDRWGHLQIMLFSFEANRPDADKDSQGAEGGRQHEAHSLQEHLTRSMSSAAMWR